MTGETLYPRLEPLLAQIQKPIQYVGGELNAQVKPWDGAAVHWALMYPDAYEVGLPNQGMMILYEVLNEQPDVLAERTYSVWPDLEALMREQGVPQFTVDGHRPVVAFDVLGVSFATELGYTVRPFEYEQYVPDIHEINHSKVVRSGGPMRGSYQSSLEKMGGAHNRCACRRDRTTGA